ncbi:MAG: peptidoglycan DD-metalloendopeptidase family protein [Streptosporangiales bacterium]|nr:peptidoglycan DD-metalloendopeptidase family protein [Streptosporangiales bacterium]
MPFPCGYTADANTRSDHSPPQAVDFQKSGIDGDSVLASAAGTVSRVENEGGDSYGRWIEIDHGGGAATRYAHLSVQGVSEGEKVSLGEKIGNAGNTGGSSGPHLHYEQLENGNPVRVTLGGQAVPYYGETSFTSKNNCGGNPHTAEEVCGAGYSVIDSAKLGSAGDAYLLYSSSSGKNCVATLKRTNVGKATATSAFLEVEGSKRATDSGDFKYYAGPVAASAKATCVKWGGSVGAEKYESGFEHCD